jgi:hypothetical protein
MVEIPAHLMDTVYLGDVMELMRRTVKPESLHLQPTLWEG